MKSLVAASANDLKGESFLRNDLHCPIKVAIVDDEVNDQRMMRHLLEQCCEFVCVGAYRSANQALEEIPKVRPRLVLMDIRMPGMDGHECTRRLKIILPQLKIIVVTALQDLDTVKHALRTGADGYLTKPVSAAQCLAMLDLSLRSSIPITERSLGKGGSSSRDAESPAACSPLTLRENQVMKLFSKGLLSKEIADQLGISFSAVHKHQLNSYRKLRAHTRTEALNRWWDTSGS